MNFYDLFEQVIAHDIPRSKYDYEDVESFTDIANGSLKPKVTTVNPRKLQATQDWIDTTRGGGKPRFEQYTKYPVIFKDDDGYHILDGHHRTYAALNRGDSKIKVYLFTRLEEASFADLKKMVPVYHVNEWSQELDIPRKVAYLYGELGFLQRGKPEQIMVKVQQFMGGGGVVPFCLEHIGDLSDRMTPRHPLHWSYGAVKEKAEKTYRSLTHSYGFEREFQENLDATIEYQKIKNPDDYRERVYRAMQIYADAHKELLPYCHTNIHKNAVYAAIMLGERKFDDAAKFVGEIKRSCASEESYHNALRAYDKKLDSKLAGEEVLDEEALERFEIGMGLEQMHNNDIALVGGMRSGSSPANLTRLKYSIYDVPMLKQLKQTGGNQNDALMGHVELMVEDGTGDLVGLINIEMKRGGKRAGYGTQVIRSIMDSPFARKPFRIYDIELKAVGFWKKMGVEFTRSDFKTPTEPTKLNAGHIFGIIR